MSFIESTGVAWSDSVSHNRVQVLSIPILLKKSEYEHKYKIIDNSSNPNYVRTFFCMGTFIDSIHMKL